MNSSQIKFNILCLFMIIVGIFFFSRFRKYTDDSYILKNSLRKTNYNKYLKEKAIIFIWMGSILLLISLLKSIFG